MPARAALVAPGTRPQTVAWLREQGVAIEWAPAPGGVAWWGALRDGQMAVVSLPGRIGLIDRVPDGIPTLVDVPSRWRSFLEGGKCSILWDGGELSTGAWSADPQREALHLALATDFIRRRIDSLPGISVVGPGPWLGAVPFLGGPAALRVNPPVEGLPGLDCVTIDSPVPARLVELLAVLDPATKLRPPSTLPRRRLGDLTLRIP